MKFLSLIFNVMEKLTLEEQLQQDPTIGPRPRKLSLEQYKLIKKQKKEESELTKIKQIKNLNKTGFRNRLLKIKKITSRTFESMRRHR